MSKAKTMLALVCAAVALWPMFSRLRTDVLSQWYMRQYGPQTPLPAAVAIIAASYTNDPSQIQQIGNAVLVDPDLGLYLTVFHVIAFDPNVMIWIGNVNGAAVPARLRLAWTDPFADLAIVQMMDGTLCQSVVPFRLAYGPPDAQSMLTVLAYHHVSQFFEPGTPRLYGFTQHYKVVSPQTDVCVDARMCQTRRAIIDLMLQGINPGPDAISALYPHQIYAENHDTLPLLGLVHGMSGGLVLDERGAVVGLARSYVVGSNGKCIFCAPAYRARTLIDRARQDIRAAIP